MYFMDSAMNEIVFPKTVKKVILDDITYKEKFLKLKDVKYYLTTVKCEKLSDYQQFNM